jgi:hypothetical protein
MCVGSYYQNHKHRKKMHLGSVSETPCFETKGQYPYLNITPGPRVVVHAWLPVRSKRDIPRIEKFRGTRQQILDFMAVLFVKKPDIWYAVCFSSSLAHQDHTAPS